MFNKVWPVSSGQGTTKFWYDAERRRFKREDVGERFVFLIPDYSWPDLLRRPQAPHPRRFARSRILTVQASTFPVRSVAKRHGYSTWNRLATIRS